MKIQPIQTNYKGYRFRSRLEARWAVFWDALDLEWSYEPEGFDLGGGVFYLPDFHLGQVNLWAEVKPRRATEHELHKCRLLAAGSGRNVLLLEGMPADRAYPIIGPSDFFDHDAILCNDRYPQKEGRFYTHVGCNCAWFFNEGCEICRCPSTRAAVHAARSARFEHGERGAA